LVPAFGGPICDGIFTNISFLINRNLKMDTQIFQTFRNQLKTIVVRNVIGSQFDGEDLQILGTTVKNFVVSGSGVWDFCITVCK
jgi:hypothetical protein